MRKLFLTLIAILLVAGVAYAADIPAVVNPKAGPEVWVTTVYNDDSSTLDVGDCVEWKIGNSTGDNDNYVEQCDSADTFIVAGIVYPVDIAVGDVGTIAIRGVVEADVINGTEAGSLLCSTTTQGSLGVCSSGTSDTDAVGFATAKPTNGGNTQLIYVFGR